MLGIPNDELRLKFSTVPVATKEYQTSCAGACWFPPDEHPVKYKYGLLAVALFVEPDTETGAPLPFGHAGVAGRVITCALVQLSLAGWAKITEVNNKQGNKVYKVFKIYNLFKSTQKHKQFMVKREIHRQENLIHKRKWIAQHLTKT